MVKIFCAFFKLFEKKPQTSPCKKSNVDCHKNYFGFILETLVSLDSFESFEINIMVHKLNLFSKITVTISLKQALFELTQLY